MYISLLLSKWESGFLLRDWGGDDRNPPLQMINIYFSSLSLSLKDPVLLSRSKTKFKVQFTKSQVGGEL